MPKLSDFIKVCHLYKKQIFVFYNLKKEVIKFYERKKFRNVIFHKRN